MDHYTTDNEDKPIPSSGLRYARAALLARSAASLLLLIAALGFPTVPNVQADQSAAARSGAVEHAQKMRRLFPDDDVASQAVPTFIPRLTTDADPSGTISSFHPNGPTQTGKNAFFLDLGANGRTCFTYHQPQDGWSLSARHAQVRFDADPNDPLFRLVDGGTCPSDEVSTLQAKRAAYQLLLAKGLIRIGLPMPSDGLQFQIVGVRDPYSCSTDQRTGLTGSTSGIVSVYRRPLPAANLGFLSTVMWDGREPDLFSQAVNATLGHAQAQAAPNLLQQQQIVAFDGCTRAATPERCKAIPDGAGVFTAQLFDSKAGLLVGETAKGGPVALSWELANFFIGINDPLGQNSTGAPFSAAIFNLFRSWEGSAGSRKETDRRNAITRGDELFNTVRIDISGVAGLTAIPKCRAQVAHSRQHRQCRC
jgi:cytochrome c peroxidase